jgi:hypothetical protein
MEEQREITTKGGIASGKARREKGRFKKLIQAALEAKITGSDGAKITVEDGLVKVLLEKALGGDLKAIQDVIDRMDGKAIQKNENEDKVDTTMTIKVKRK